jgi:WD40 repeat protein
LATVSLDGIMRQWDVAKGKMRASIPVSLPFSVRTALAPDGRTMAQVRWDKNPTQIQLRRITAGTAHALAGGSSPVAFGADNHGLVQVSDMALGHETWTLCRNQGHIWALAFSPDGRTLASGGLDGTVRLWDVESGSEKTTLQGHTDQVGAVAFSPDGRLLASGSHDTTIKVWDTGTAEEVASLHGHTGTITCVGFDPTGHWIASSSHDHTVRLWPLGNEQ